MGFFALKAAAEIVAHSSSFASHSGLSMETSGIMDCDEVVKTSVGRLICEELISGAGSGCNGECTFSMDAVALLGFLLDFFDQSDFPLESFCWGGSFLSMSSRGAFRASEGEELDAWD
jgi:hypothetical protein